MHRSVHLGTQERSHTSFGCSHIPPLPLVSPCCLQLFLTFASSHCYSLPQVSSQTPSSFHSLFSVVSFLSSALICLLSFSTSFQLFLSQLQFLLLPFFTSSHKPFDLNLSGVVRGAVKLTSVYVCVFGCMLVIWKKVIGLDTNCKSRRFKLS